VGLYIVEKILKQHQASIQVNSKLNEGTQVVVRFNSAPAIAQNEKTAIGNFFTN
jgi:signal transduction histidine kinase